MSMLVDTDLLCDINNHTPAYHATYPYDGLYVNRINERYLVLMYIDTPRNIVRHHCSDVLQIFLTHWRRDRQEYIGRHVRPVENLLSLCSEDVGITVL